MPTAGGFTPSARCARAWTSTVTAPGTPDLDLRLTVLPRPELQDLNIAVRPPLHTGLAPFEQRNDGDLDVPEGSVIEFQLGTRNARPPDRALGQRFRGPPRRRQPLQLQGGWHRPDLRVVARSQEVSEEDSVRYRLRTLADRRPTIRVLEVSDSLSLNRIAFNGIVQDDYGFSSPSAFRPPHARGDAEAHDARPALRREDSFIHFWNLTDAGVGLGDEVEYWFEVRDNDGVNGPKMTRSRTFVHQAPTAEELAQQLDSADADMTAAWRPTLKKPAGCVRRCANCAANSWRRKSSVGRKRPRWRNC